MKKDSMFEAMRIKLTEKLNAQVRKNTNTLLKKPIHLINYKDICAQDKNITFTILSHFTM